MTDKAEAELKAKDEGGFGETVKVIIQALLIALVIRTVLFQPFNIPSGSLIPTLLIGDYLFVSKYSYGYSRFSLPQMPDSLSWIVSKSVELHTGSWCDAIVHGQSDKANQEFGRIRVAAARAEELGIECHAGHGLDFDTARKIASLPQIVELNIGHFLMGEAIFVGLSEAIHTMRKAMDEGRSGGA